MAGEKVNCIIADITTMTNASKVQLWKKSTEGFQEVNTQLQSLVNSILEKVPEANVVQQTGELNTGKKVRIVQILPQELDTNSEDVNLSIH